MAIRSLPSASAPHRFDAGAGLGAEVDVETDRRFDALTENLRALARRGEIRRFRKGQRLIEEGEDGNTFFIILSGRVSVFGSDFADGRKFVYNTVGPGDYIGELILDGGPRSASAEAIEPCECVVVTRQTLEEHIKEHPTFAVELLTRVIRRARAATEVAKRLALKHVYERLVLLLNELALPQEDGTRAIAERLTHRDLASRVGSSREMVSRLMKDLEEGGYVAVDERGTLLLRPLPPRW